MKVVLDEATVSWGIKVERVEMYDGISKHCLNHKTQNIYKCSKDARLPVMLQRAMAAEAEAAREARAKVR